MKKTPYSVILDLGKIVPREFFINLAVGDESFRFQWSEPKIGELLKMVRDLDSAYDPDTLKYQVSLEQTVFGFLNGLNPKFEYKHFSQLGAENIQKIVETILEPIFKKDEGTAKTGETPKKKALKTLV